MARVKAGIVDIEEAKRRLIAGETFYYYGGRLHYDASFILKEESPFRYESVSIESCWWFVQDWRMEEFLNMSLGGDASCNKKF